MKTFLNVKTGNRLPEHGCNAWFVPAWSKKARAAGKWDHHVKWGPEYTNGWKNVNFKVWKEEDIPDLDLPFTDEEFKAYARAWGVDCAQEFLECADIVKPTWALRIITPRKNEPTPEAQKWFLLTFGEDCFRFAVPMIDAFLNTYSFDILVFEKFLSNHFGYPRNQDGSMRDFMVTQFGQDNEDKFIEYFLKS